MPSLRYITANGDEGEHEPGSRGRVLRNLVGIKTKTAMDRAEYEDYDALTAFFAEAIECRLSKLDRGRGEGRRAPSNREDCRAFSRNMRARASGSRK